MTKETHTEGTEVRIVEGPDTYWIVNAATGDDMEPWDKIGWSYGDAAARHARAEGWEVVGEVP